MSKLKKISGYIVLFIFFFFIFLYFTFPYDILKESVSQEVSKMTGYTVSIGELNPAFPFGLEADDVKLSKKTSTEVVFKHMEVTMGILPLLIGKVDIGLEIAAKNGDDLEVNTGLSLFLIFGSDNILPSYLSMESDKFPVGDLVNFLLTSASEDPNANPLVAPMLKNIKFKGMMLSDIDLDLDIDQPNLSSGSLEISFKKSSLEIREEGLNIPKQEFTKSQIKAKLNNGIMKISETSGLKSQDLDIKLGGKITVRQSMMRSPMLINIPIVLSGPLKEQFGFVIDAVTGQQKDGKLTVKVSGTLGRPNIVAQ